MAMLKHCILMCVVVG